MATELTTPIGQTSITHQGIIRFEVLIPHKRNAAGDAAIINKDGISVRYEVTTWSEAGDVVSRASRLVPFANWPASFKTDMKAVYEKLEQDAKANGLIQPGIDEPLE